MLKIQKLQNICTDKTNSQGQKIRTTAILHFKSFMGIFFTGVFASNFKKDRLNIVNSHETRCSRTYSWQILCVF